ncbi:MAG: glycine dehydrogenase, partial [Candidatus Marinimicrobia bacterium CG_4_10_14_0_2_um_filter_48_9]
IPAKTLIERAGAVGFLAGVAVEDFFPGSPNELLVAVTEKRTRSELDRFINFLKTIS